MVNLHQKRDFVRVFAGDTGEDAVGGSDRVATALNGQPHDVLRVKILRIDGKRRPGGVLNPLIDRQDGNIAGTCETAMIQNLLVRAQHHRRAVILRKDAVNIIAAGQVQRFLRDGGAVVVEQGFCFITKQLANV